MGTFEDLEREISEQNAALESLLAELENEEIANEALFKEKVTVDDLLEKVKAAADACKSSEDCEKLLAKLKEEEDKFNKCFKDMKDAAEKFKDGKIEKSELNEVMVSATKEIKKACELLALKDVDEDLEDVKDAEIEMLRDFLVKSREVIEEKCESFCDSDDDDKEEESEETSEEEKEETDSEDKEEEKEEDEKEEKEEEAAEESAATVVEETVEETVVEETSETSAEEEVATEGNNLDAKAAKKHYGKEAKALAKEAKRLYKAGDFAGAKQKYEEAAALADALVKEVESLDPSVGSAILGYFAQCAKMFALGLLVCIPTLGIGNIVLGIKEMIAEITAIIAAINKIGKGTLSVNDFNMYTNRIKQYGQKLAKEYRNAAKKCTEAGKAHESYMAGYMAALEEFAMFDFDDDFEIEETETIEEE